MSITNSSSARRAGFKVNDKTVKDLAAISMAKIGTRTLHMALPPQAWHLVGTNVVVQSQGVFNVIQCPDANTADLYTSFRLPAEYDSGNLTLTIYWLSSAVAGNVKLTAQLAGKAVGGTTASEETIVTVTTVSATSLQLNKHQFNFNSADVTALDLVGIHITRDPADVLDTLGADIVIVSAFLDYVGRG